MGFCYRIIITIFLHGYLGNNVKNRYIQVDTILIYYSASHSVGLQIYLISAFRKCVGRLATTVRDRQST